MKKIYIDPGHSINDPGAVKYAVEFDLNESVSKYQAEFLLANYKCEVKVCPPSISSLSAICKDANDWGADLFVSNHFNAGGGDGYEALVYSEKRVPLGEIFAKHVQAIGQNLRLYGAAPGVKIRTNLSVLKYTNMPAVLNEGAFVDNLKDIQDWDDADELKALGIAYAKATAEFLSLEKKQNIVEGAKPTEIYPLEQFIRDVQSVTGSDVDGIAGPQTLGNTVTISRYKNREHKVVQFIQKRLLSLGYVQVGKADGIAGAMFEEAMKAFQEDNGCTVDGEATAKKKTWQKLLGML